MNSEKRVRVSFPSDQSYDEFYRIKKSHGFRTDAKCAQFIMQKGLEAIGDVSHSQGGLPATRGSSEEPSKWTLLLSDLEGYRTKLASKYYLCSGLTK